MEKQGIAMSVSVCGSVCLSVCEHISKFNRPDFAKCLCMLPVTVARSASGDDISYVYIG